MSEVSAVLSGAYDSLVQDVEQLIRQHGDEADMVAAQRADASFGAGDKTAGNRWTHIFRILAAAHIRLVRERKMSRAESH